MTRVWDILLEKWDDCSFRAIDNFTALLGICVDSSFRAIDNSMALCGICVTVPIKLEIDGYRLKHIAPKKFSFAPSIFVVY